MYFYCCTVLLLAYTGFLVSALLRSSCVSLSPSFLTPPLATISSSKATSSHAAIPPTPSKYGILPSRRAMPSLPSCLIYLIVSWWKTSNYFLFSISIRVLHICPCAFCGPSYKHNVLLFSLVSKMVPLQKHFQQYYIIYGISAKDLH